MFARRGLSSQGFWITNASRGRLDALALGRICFARLADVSPRSGAISPQSRSSHHARGAPLVLVAGVAASWGAPAQVRNDDPTDA